MRFLMTLLSCFGGQLAAQSCLPAPPVIPLRIVPVEVLPLPKRVESLPQITPKKEPPKPPLMPLEERLSVFTVERGTSNRKEEGFRVRFFNHSERDLILEVEGQELKLPSGESLKRKVPREFIWKEKGQSENRQSIPADSLGIDVVIRW
jgi:hypothetical protein